MKVLILLSISSLLAFLTEVMEHNPLVSCMAFFQIGILGVLILHEET